MPAETRFDLSGGLNTVSSPEIVSDKELRLAKNMQTFETGGLTTRPGSQRIHTNAIGSGGPVLGLFRWFAPSGWETLAVAGGNLYKKTDVATDFTLVSAGFSTTVPTEFFTWRVGATVIVLMADTVLRSWDGTTLTTVAGAPNCTMLRPYKGRLWVAGDAAAPKRFYGSVLNDYTDWNVGNGAVVGDAEQFDHEPINGLATVGSSLMIYKEDATQRFIGVSAADFNLDRDSEGISRKIGCIAPQSIVELEGHVYALSDQGPFVATEGGAVQIAKHLGDVWASANKAAWGGACGGWQPLYEEHRLWLPIGVQTTNLTGYWFSARTNSWTGPHVMRDNANSADLGVRSIADYELATGENMVMIGGYDGFVRLCDNVDLDDVLLDGSGGAGISWDVLWPDLHFGNLQVTKGLEDLAMSLDLGADQEATVYWSADGGPEESVVVHSAGPGVRSYAIGRLGVHGRRFQLGVRGVATEAVRVNGFELQADNLRL